MTRPADYSNPRNPYNRPVRATFAWSEELPHDAEVEEGDVLDMDVELEVVSVEWGLSVKPGDTGKSPTMDVRLRPRRG